MNKRENDMRGEGGTGAWVAVLAPAALAEVAATDAERIAERMRQSRMRRALRKSVSTMSVDRVQYSACNAPEEQ